MVGLLLDFVLKTPQDLHASIVTRPAAAAAAAAPAPVAPTANTEASDFSANLAFLLGAAALLDALPFSDAFLFAGMVRDLCRNGRTEGWREGWREGRRGVNRRQIGR